MNYDEFMRELERLLADVPADEREEALQYYADYFADAGRENEAQVLAELGSPQKVAATIKAGLKGGADDGEFTEWGYKDERFVKRDDLARREPKEEKKSQNRYSYQAYEAGNNAYNNRSQSYGNENQTYGSGYGSGMQGDSSSQKKSKPWTSGWLKALLIVLIVLCALPVGAPVIIGAAAVILGLVIACFAVFFGLVIGACGVVIAGIVVICAGISKLAVIPSAALLATGIGLLVFVIGLIAAAASIRLCMMVYPALFRFLVGICRKPFHRKAGV